MTRTDDTRAAVPAPTRIASLKAAPTIPLSLFGIALGLVAVGGGWYAAHQLLAAPAWPSEVFYAVGGVLWLVFGAVYLAQGMRRRGTFDGDVKHPAAGPFAALIPLVGILLASHYALYLPGLGTAAVVVFVAALAVVATQIFAHWLTGGVTMAAIHPGYFIPVVAGAFVASIGFTSVELHEVAIASFGVGLFFWFVIGTVVVVRLMTGGPLPDGAKPSLSAFLAAPATASIAWMIAHPGAMGEVQLALTGVLVVMLLVQVVLLREFRKLSFSLTFWVFTFPIASTAHYAVRWFAASGLPGAAVWAWIALSLSTAFVLALGALTVLSLTKKPSKESRTHVHQS